MNDGCGGAISIFHGSALHWGSMNGWNAMHPPSVCSPSSCYSSRAVDVIDIVVKRNKTVFGPS